MGLLGGRAQRENWNGRAGKTWMEEQPGSEVVTSICLHNGGILVPGGYLCIPSFAGCPKSVEFTDDSEHPWNSGITTICILASTHRDKGFSCI